MSSNLYSDRPAIHACDNDFETYAETSEATAETSEATAEQGTITIDYGRDNFEFISTSVVLMNKESLWDAELGWALYMEGCLPIVLDSSGSFVGSCEALSPVNTDINTIASQTYSLSCHGFKGRYIQWISATGTNRRALIVETWAIVEFEGN